MKLSLGSTTNRDFSGREMDESDLGCCGSRRRKRGSSRRLMKGTEASIITCTGFGVDLWTVCVDVDVDAEVS
jgi:hypothetical protein